MIVQAVLRWRCGRRHGAALAGVSLLVLALLLVHLTLTTTERPADPMADLLDTASPLALGAIVAPSADLDGAAARQPAPHTILEECPALHALPPLFLLPSLLALLAAARVCASAAQNTLDAHVPQHCPRPPLALPLPTPAQPGALLQVFLN